MLGVEACVVLPEAMRGLGWLGKPVGKETAG